VRQLNTQGKTVIYTTHIMSEAETLCDRVAIIDRGELLAMGAVDELKTSLQREGVTHIEGVIPSKAATAVRSIPSVLRATRTSQDGGALLTVVTASGREILPQLIEVLTRSGAVIQKITPEELTLEDVFIAKTGRTLAEDTRIANK
jgi:ABC-2 type transport system ATP-binding protein